MEMNGVNLRLSSLCLRSAIESARPDLSVAFDAPHTTFVGETMSSRHWLTLFVLLGVIGSAAAGPPDAVTVYHTVNASMIGNSWRLLSWVAEQNQTRVPCSPYCNYLRISTAKIAPDAATKFAPITWPDAGVTYFPNPANVESAVPFTPPDTKIYQSTTYERGAVEYLRSGDASITSKVFKSGGQPTPQNGTATAAMAYHVVAQNPSSGARDYFIHFYAPVPHDGPTLAYNMISNQPIFLTQDYAKGRSSVDVLVNGLPVWSTASHYFFPEDYSGPPTAGFKTSWGYAAADDEYRIFVGRFAAGATFTIDYIVHADSAARAPKCGTESQVGPTTIYYARCFLMGNGRDLPAINASERFEIYSADLSTAPIQNFPLP
jgi:hypothetical protein